MTIHARTNYASVANGGLDPLWQAHGRHMGPGCYIGAEADPKGGSFRVQRQTWVDGGVFSGGERAEVLNTDLINTPFNGGRFQIGYRLLLPTGFTSSSSGWNGLSQMHYAGAISQSPWSISIINSNQLYYRTLGGPLNGNGSAGTIVNDGVIATLSHNVWHTLCMDVKLDLSSGMFDLWLDGTQILNLRASTLSPDAGNSTYWKQGGYRNELDSGTASYYFQDTICWKNTSPDEMLTYYGVGTTPPPVGNAQLTLNANTVSHTLPAKFWGLGHSPYASSNDQPIAAYETLGNALEMEVFRIHAWGCGTDPANSNSVALKDMALDYKAAHDTATIVQLNVKSVDPSQNPTGNYPNDIPASGDGSPEQMASTLAAWQGEGLDVLYLEPYNEPYNNRVGGVGDEWKNHLTGYSGSSDNDKAGNACRDWAAIYQRKVYEQLVAEGVNVPIAGCVIAGAALDYIWGEVLRWCEPNTYIPSTPRSDSNYAYFDTYSCHAYLSAADDDTQSGLNSMFYRGSPGNTDASATTAFCNNFRTHLDSKNKTAAKMIFTECAVFEGGSEGGLFDACYAIMFARNQEKWNVGAFTYHSLDTTNVDLVINDDGHTHTTFQRTVRYRVMQQLVSPFIRLYKKQLFSDDTLVWSTEPGLSDGGLDSNPVSRLQIAAGLNAAEDTIGVLVANIDLATAETLTLDLPVGIETSAAATYTKMAAGVTYSAGQDIASLATGTVSGSAAGQSSVEQAIGAGEAWLILIPVDSGSVVQPPEYLGGVYDGPTAHGSQIDKQRCYRATVVYDGTVTSIATKRAPQPVTGTETVRLAVWADNGSGTEPSTGALLGSTAEMAFTADTAPGTYSLDVTVPFAVSAGDIVWIGDISGGTPNIANVYRNSIGQFRLQNATYSAGPVPWSPSTDAAFEMELAIWLEGTPTVGLPPVNSVAPAISGVAKVGSVVTVTSSGTWTGSPSFAYQWQRDNGAGDYSNISGATGTSYTLTAADRLMLVRCAVTATNVHGSTVGSSNAIGRIESATGTRTVSTHSLAVSRTIRAGRRLTEGGGG